MLLSRGALVRVSCSARQSSTVGGTNLPLGPFDTDKSHVPETRRSGVQSSLRRGTGGRSSFSGIVATVFGATGGLGRYVCNRLGKNGAQIIIPYRGEAYDARHLKLAGDLGQILFMPYYLRDDESIRKAVKYSNIVINLVGRDFETNNFSYDDVHVDGARRIARIAREMGVPRMIHVSALNATPSPPEVLIAGGSQFLRTKALGEQAVREEFPSATIVRPAVMFGMEDRFLHTYINPIRRRITKIELYARGELTYKAPVAFADVAQAINLIANDDTLDGRTYELAGPRCYRFADIIDWMYIYTNRAPPGYRRMHLSFINGIKTNILYYYLKLYKWSMFAWNWDCIERTECISDYYTGESSWAELGFNRRLKDFGEEAPVILNFYDRSEPIHTLDREYKPPPPPSYPVLSRDGPQTNEENKFDHLKVEEDNILHQLGYV